MQKFDLEKIASGLLPEPGRLLLAEPYLLNPDFWRTVILLCDHNEKGSFGLVLNRKLKLTLGDVIPDLSFFVAPLHYGGPVQPDTLHYLHRAEDNNAIKESILLYDQVRWGGDFDDLCQKLHRYEILPNDIRFFVGYSGWDENQLKTDNRENSWIAAHRTNATICDENPSTLLHEVLRSMGGIYASIANFPEHPMLN